ncbi:MAG: hemolysin III family protein [Desulfobacterales bacterium]|nr:hemolysin III family protein [Desulfobacterales bacterium]
MKIQTRGEEIANSITHGIATLLSIAGLVILLVVSAAAGSVWAVTSLSIFGTSLIILYLVSTLYHSITHIGAKRVLKILDHSSIYLLIAGSYTPIALVILRGPWGWSLFGIIWGMALLGVCLHVFALDRFKILSILSYLIMGWLVVIAIKPLTESCEKGLIFWLLTGGLAYTFGTIFYSWKKLPYHHTLWHLFVIGGSIAHFFGMLFYIAPG